MLLLLLKFTTAYTQTYVFINTHTHMYICNSNRYMQTNSNIILLFFRHFELHEISLLIFKFDFLSYILYI